MSKMPQHGGGNKQDQSRVTQNRSVSDGDRVAASGLRNLTRIIVALAIRQADFLATLVKKGAF